MNGILMLLAAAAPGVDYGWQPGADGQLEYIIQIEPALLSALQRGEEIVSQIHPDARGVRRFRIRVSTEEPPRVAAPLDGPTAVSQPTDDSRGGGFSGTDSLPTPQPAAGPNDGANSTADTAVPMLPWPSFDRPGDISAGGGEFGPPAAATDVDPPVGDAPPHEHDPAVDHQPATLSPEPVGDPLPTRRADYIEEATPAANDASADDPSQVAETPAAMVESGETSPAKPWLPLVLTALLLFASVGLNAYLGWTAWGFYQRIGSLTSEAQPAAGAG